MKPPPFTYHVPGTVSELTKMLARLENAKILAGGQSLMPLLNLRYVLPDHVIDINRIPELSGISLRDGHLVLGAMARQREIAASELVRRHCPLMVEALEFVGHMQTRSRGTIGGSLCHLDPAAELPAVALAHDAVIHVASERGVREVPCADWFAGYMAPNLISDELLQSVSLPPWPPHHGHAFLEFSRRRGDFALVGVACLLALDRSGRVERASVAVAGLDTRPHRCTEAEAALSGSFPDPALFEAAARHVAGIEALSDSYADKVYRRRVARVLAERALVTAAARAARQRDG